MINDLIDKLKHLPDDHIGDGIYVAYDWCENQLVRLYIGSKINGIMLQYDANGKGKYNGKNEIDYKNGCWTNCYSRGNFGKKYALGGNWSGHTKNLHQRLNLSPIVDEKYEMLIDDIGNQIILPDGIKGEIGVTEMDCSGGWSIWYTTAKAALSARLKKEEINESSLPDITKQHLLKNETQLVLDALNDVIEAYEL